MNSILISAIHKSSGKTTVTLGLSAALARRGAHIQTFKKGPDYIDPMWLTRASGHPCRNLDFQFMSAEQVACEFVTYGADADLAIVEGNKGLFDGVDVEGSDSNAALASLLGTPIVLVVDTRGMTRGIAPLIKGYCDFAEDIKIAGVILNQVGGPRHEGKMRAALERYTDVPVIGSISRHPEMEIIERHLGLVPANESDHVEQKVNTIADIIEDGVDLGIFGALACTTRTSGSIHAAPIIRPTRAPDVRIAVARDAAFGFYYPGDLEALEDAGAELIPLDTLNDTHLPDVDGLFIGGGFPETQAIQLAANTGLRNEIKSSLENGLPAYAECAGLMYLSRSLTWNGECHDMVGFIPGDAVMHQKPVGRGYVQLVETRNAPWPFGHPDGNRTPAHEFHYASLDNLPDDLVYAHKVTRGVGIDGQRDTIVLGNTVAGFAHHRNIGTDGWARRFVEFVRQCKHSRNREAKRATG
jgi:cobyrinic acid a,c-diamide synthase